jgi:hypothetical protein
VASDASQSALVDCPQMAGVLTPKFAVVSSGMSMVPAPPAAGSRVPGAPVAAALGVAVALESADGSFELPLTERLKIVAPAMTTSAATTHPHSGMRLRVGSASRPG